MDHAVLRSHQHLAGVTGRLVLHTRSNNRSLWLQQRHRLLLHVGAHQGAVGIVVLQEGDQGRTHRNNLLRRDIHIGDLLRWHHREPVTTADAHNHLLRNHPVLSVKRRVRLRDHHLLLAVSREVVNDVRRHRLDVHSADFRLLDRRNRGLVQALASLDDNLARFRVDCIITQDLTRQRQDRILDHQLRDHAPVRRLDEAVLVDLAVGGQRPDKADVRSFRRLDRTNAAIVRRVNVAHVEACPVTAKATRAERRKPPLVRQLRQGVGLVHELRELAATEELTHRCHHRPRRADERLRRHRLGILDRHTLADTALQALEPGPHMHLDQLAYRTNAAVPEVVDIVGLAQAVAETDHLADDLDEILLGQNAAVWTLASRLVSVQALVELVAADPGKIVAAVVEEQILQHRRRVIARRRITRAQAPIQLDQRVVLRLGGILLQRRAQEWTIRVRVDVGQRLAELFVGHANGAQQDGDRHLALAVNLYRHHVAVGGLELQPGAAVRDQLGGGHLLAGGGIRRSVEIDARGTHQLRHHNALGAVDDERTVRGHDREVPDKDLGILVITRTDLADLSGFGVDDPQFRLDAQR